MQFILMEVNRLVIGKFIMAINTAWRKSIDQRFVNLIRDLCRCGEVDAYVIRQATDISVTLARVLKTSALLTTCTVSEDRLLTINIPTNSDSEFYQIRVQPISESSVLQVSMFYPSSSDAAAAAFYGPIAARMTYEYGWGEADCDLRW